MSRGAASAAGGRKLLAHHVRWLWRGPRRALCAALDLYARGLTGCAGHFPADDHAAFGYVSFAAFGYPTFVAGPSFASSGSNAEQAREQQWQRHPAVVPRSHSVADMAVARIDEDGPCDFASAAADAVVFPRSRSCAPRGSGRVAALAA